MRLPLVRMLLAGVLPPVASLPASVDRDSVGPACPGLTRDVLCVGNIGRLPLHQRKALIRVGSTDGRISFEFWVSIDGERSNRRVLAPRLADPLSPWQNRAFSDGDRLVGPAHQTPFSVTTRADTLGWTFFLVVPRAGLLDLEPASPWTLSVWGVDGGQLTKIWEGTADPAIRARALAVTPFGYSLLRQQRSGLIGTTNAQEFGGEFVLAPVPWLAIRGAVRPQFTEVEPDEQRITLTRYRLRVPERRAALADLDARFDPVAGPHLALFESRRVSLDSLGRSVPVTGFGRLEARVAGAEVEGFVALTDETRTQRSQQYGAARIQKRFGGLTLRGVAVQRSAPDAPSLDRNQTFAVDGAWRFGRGWSVEGWTALTRSPRFRGGDQAYGMGLAHQGSRLRTSARFAQIGEFFNPEVGYLMDRALRRYEGDLRLTLGGAGIPGVIAIVPRASYAGHFRLGDQFHLASTLRLSSGFMVGRSLVIEPSVTRRHEGLLAPFAIASTTTLPRGQYRWAEVGLTIRGALLPSLHVDARFDGGGLYNGSQIGGAVAVDLRPADWLGVSVLTDINHIRLDQGGFDRVLVGTRLAVRPARGVGLEALIQYNNSVRLWTANARVTWHDRHGSGLTIALDDAHEADRLWRWVRPQVRSLSVKVSKQIRLGPLSVDHRPQVGAALEKPGFPGQRAAAAEGWIGVP